MRITIQAQKDFEAAERQEARRDPEKRGNPLMIASARVIQHVRSLGLTPTAIWQEQGPGPLTFLVDIEEEGWAIQRLATDQYDRATKGFNRTGEYPKHAWIARDGVSLGPVLRPS